MMTLYERADRIIASLPSASEDYLLGELREVYWQGHKMGVATGSREAKGVLLGLAKAANDTGQTRLASEILLLIYELRTATAQKDFHDKA